MITATERETIERAIHRELCKGIVKHGDWSDYTYWKMLWVIFTEFMEVIKALIRNDLRGKHGVFIESCQVSACCIKLCNQVILRKKYVYSSRNKE